MSRDELWRNTWAGAEAEDDEEAPSDAELDVDVCERCRYTACEACAVHHSRGYCKDANFGHAYPPEGSEEREWYHRGCWCLVVPPRPPTLAKPSATEEEKCVAQSSH